MNYTNTEAANRSGETISFSFGQNWGKFLDSVTEERVHWACESIQNFTGLSSLEGKTFLDAGCGSGLFSLAAYKLGAARVVSFDIDPNSIHCAELLKSSVVPLRNWQIVRGSILTLPFKAGEFDIVYSWGVVHHTGAMWDALKQVSGVVSPKGLLYLAIYTEGRFSRQWLSIKRFYNSSSWLVRKTMLGIYAGTSLLWMLIHGQNPIKHVMEYAQTGRGMSWFRDIEDWLGGLPYEYAKPDAVECFMESIGFRMMRQTGMEYLFERST